MRALSCILECSIKGSSGSCLSAPLLLPHRFNEREQAASSIGSPRLCADSTALPHFRHRILGGAGEKRVVAHEFDELKTLRDHFFRHGGGAAMDAGRHTAFLRTDGDGADPDEPFPGKNVPMMGGLLYVIAFGAGTASENARNTSPAFAGGTRWTNSGATTLPVRHSAAGLL